MDSRKYRIAIFGLGYVGSVSAACLASDGHRVVGVDPQATKTDLINGGHSPVIEPGLGQLIAEARAAGRLAATADPEQAMATCDIAIVCVGTPSRPNGSLDLSHVAEVCGQIGRGLRRRNGYPVVVIRSTILPGTMRELVLPTLEKESGRRAGIDFGLANNPEFLRESTAVKDFYNPPKTVIGALDERSAATVAALYAGLPAPLIVTAIEVAEMVKYTDNAWHALKVAFANEIGNVCKALKVDSHAVMDIFCQDTKLNLSPYYLKPGYAFGGSCLPKDLRALTYKARSLDVEAPVLDSILRSNSRQVERAIDHIVAKRCRNIGVLGFAFKAGTDDLRESPIVELVERLIGKGFNIRLFDRSVNLAKVVGANRDYILRAIPHISNLMADSIDEVVDFSDLIIIGTNDPEIPSIAGRLKPGQAIVDMVRIPEIQARGNGYEGINW